MVRATVRHVPSCSGCLKSVDCHRAYREYNGKLACFRFRQVHPYHWEILCGFRHPACKAKSISFLIRRADWLSGLQTPLSVTGLAVSDADEAPGKGIQLQSRTIMVGNQARFHCLLDKLRTWNRRKLNDDETEDISRSI